MAQQQDMGLFGIPSASDILRQQQQQDQMLAMRQAQLAPGQGLIYQAASAGQRAGRSIAGLFGIEDPALKEATEMDAVKKAVASQWDGSDPEKALELFVQEANKRGLVQQALSASDRLTKMKAEKEKTELGKKKIEAEIGLASARVGQAEASAEASRARAAAAGQPKPSDLGTLQRERNNLRTLMQNSESELEKEELRQQIAEIDAAIAMKTTREAKDKTPPSVGQDREAIAQEIYGKGFYDLTPAEKAVVNKRADERAERTKPSVSVTVEGEKSFAKQMGEEDAKAVVEARKLRNTAIGELSSLNEMATRNQQNITSGTFASGRVGVANFFNTIGLLGANDVKKLANSEVYTKSAGDLVLAKIKALGSNPSNADREFIVRIVPQLENSPQARAELISYLQKRANDVIKESSSLESYARQNKGLSGYVPTIPLTISPQTAKKASDMTDQELIDAYKSGRR